MRQVILVQRLWKTPDFHLRCTSKNHKALLMVIRKTNYPQSKKNILKNPIIYQNTITIPNQKCKTPTIFEMNQKEQNLRLVWELRNLIYHVRFMIIVLTLSSKKTRKVRPRDLGTPIIIETLCLQEELSPRLLVEGVVSMAWVFITKTALTRLKRNFRIFQSLLPDFSRQSLLRVALEVP